MTFMDFLIIASIILAVVGIVKKAFKFAVGAVILAAAFYAASTLAGIMLIS